MKKSLLLVAIGLTLSLVACGQADEEIREPIVAGTTKSLIIMLDENTSDEQIQELCDTYNLDLMYNYDIISGCAVSINEDLDEAGVESLMASLEEYDYVLGVEKDSVVTLDDGAN